MDAVVKNQHYIPQCILTQFSNERSQEYEVLVDKKILPILQNVRIQWLRDLHMSIPEIEKNRSEKYFSKIESYFGPAMIKVEKNIQLFEEGTITIDLLKDSFEKYLREVMIFYYRSGALLHEFEFQRERKHDRIGLLLENIMNSSYIRRLASTIIENYNFAVIKSDNNDFLLSDQYLSTVALGIKNRFFPISNRHIGLKNVLLLIPISCSITSLITMGISLTTLRQIGLICFLMNRCTRPIK